MVVRSNQDGRTLGKPFRLLGHLRVREWRRRTSAHRARSSASTGRRGEDSGGRSSPTPEIRNWRTTREPRRSPRPWVGAMLWQIRLRGSGGPRSESPQGSSSDAGRRIIDCRTWPIQASSERACIPAPSAPGQPACGDRPALLRRPIRERRCSRFASDASHRSGPSSSRSTASDETSGGSR